MLKAFAEPRFRAAALGYFGHMWELYAAWTLAPLLLIAAFGTTGGTTSMGAFGFIALGGLGCILGGQLSRRFGSAAVAATALATSGLICLLFPWLLALPTSALVLVLAIWAVAIAADSPQFSALASSAAPPHAVGSALAIMNSLGFGISVVAIKEDPVGGDGTDGYPATGAGPGPGPAGHATASQESGVGAIEDFAFFGPGSNLAITPKNGL